MEDWTHADDRFVVDVHPQNDLPFVTHQTRDGMDMCVQYQDRPGYAVWITSHAQEVAS